MTEIEILLLSRAGQGEIAHAPYAFIQPPLEVNKPYRTRAKQKRSEAHSTTVRINMRIEDGAVLTKVVLSMRQYRMRTL